MVKYFCEHVGLYVIFILFSPNEKYSQLHTEISEALGSEKKKRKRDESGGGMASKLPGQCKSL
jgi:hypothetical protein